VRQAHVVGVSMGGMIAQRVALAVPQRVLSLTSIMSSSGAKGLPGPAPEVLRAMLSRPTGSSKAAVIEHSVGLFRAIGSPAFPLPESDLSARITRGVERAFYPVGTLRQMVAVVSDHARAALLGRIASPTLVVHGTADPLVPLACGQDTARRIPGAKLVTIEGMGHDLPGTGAPHSGRPLVPHHGPPRSSRTSHEHPEQSQLGKSSAYVDRYDASLLFPIPALGQAYRDRHYRRGRRFSAPTCGPRSS